MTNNQDKILAIVCVALLIFSIAFFSVVKETEEIVSETLRATREYTTGGIATNMKAETLHELINDNDTTNDPFILSIRKTEHYALGHIPGAVNIPLSTLFTEENLAKLPTDRQIVVYCYTGHTASQATALLNVNGYDAVCLTSGMCSWTNNSTVTVNTCYDETTAAHDYPVSSGTDPGSIGIVATINMFAPRAAVHTVPAKTVTPKPLGCGGDTEPPQDTSSDISDSSIYASDALSEATYSSLNQGKPATMTAEDLYDNLYDGDSSNDPFILSVRKAEHYELGHIPGAVNIGITSLFTQENLQKLPADKNQQIVVVCYTGHTASQATALLNLNGCNATALKFGMCSWTIDANVTAGKCYNKTTDSHDYSFSTGIWDEDFRVKIHDSLNQGKPVAITAESLYDRLNDNDTTNDPFILSIRKAEHYEFGHIPGAINIGITSLFTEENLSKLPYDKQIVVVCYTGHTASQATALLNAIGYNATALKWGMCSWTTNSTVTVNNMCYDQTTDVQNYPFVAGAELGSMP
jgi:rhodanese-related sulfurtransferase